METNTHTNLSYLKELSNGSNEFILQMINLFIASTPPAVADIEKNLKEGDWAKLKFTAHKMKPGILFMGIKELETVIPDIEELAAKATRTEQLSALINKLKLVIPVAIKELEEQKVEFS